MGFGNGGKNIQAAAYNGARTVCTAEDKRYEPTVLIYTVVATVAIFFFVLTMQVYSSCRVQGQVNLILLI